MHAREIHTARQCGWGSWLRACTKGTRGNILPRARTPHGTPMRLGELAARVYEGHPWKHCQAEVTFWKCFHGKLLCKFPRVPKRSPVETDFTKRASFLPDKKVSTVNLFPRVPFGASRGKSNGERFPRVPFAQCFHGKLWASDSAGSHGCPLVVESLPWKPFQ